MKKQYMVIAALVILTMMALAACQQNSGGQAFKKLPGSTLNGNGTNQTGSLSVSSNPSGAAVRVDGTFRGNTPLTVTGLSVGTHTVIVAKPGHTSVTRNVTINAGETTNLNVRLFPAEATIVAEPEPNDYCTDSDGGQDIFVTGTVTVVNDTGNYSITDYCSSGFVVEQYCTGTIGQSAFMACPNGWSCGNGRCNPVSNNTCIDTDNGIVPQTRGTISGVYNGNNYSYTDSCPSTSTLREYFCLQDGRGNNTILTCATTCTNGACV